MKHLAIIMDGNGRWAERKDKKRAFGHEEGARNVRTITEYAAENGIEYLTLYAFSTENWKRPKTEVAFLMKLLAKFLKQELEILIKNNIRFEVIGDISRFSPALQASIHHVKSETSTCSGMVQILAINYGSRDEITRAVNSAIKNGKEISEQDLSTLLDTSLFPDVDLLIRTGGDQRLSNFLLWQAAYAELFFTSTLWPDFSCGELKTILTKYVSTTRKFGAL
jgi:undecaprenyl diphosphate synthase